MNAKLLVRRGVVAALPLVLAACSGFITDFKRQPSVKPWQVFKADSAEKIGFRGNPQASISTNGTLLPEWVVSYQPLPGTIDSIAAVANPVAADSASVRRGRAYYQINCAPCHGHAGKGDGTATKLGMVPMPLLSDRAKNFTDGYIWGMMRNGRGLMPSYNRIEEMDRWDVVNYVRALQGKIAIAADTTPPGLPGETGAKLPGATRIGPGRSVPYVHPTVNAVPKSATEGASAGSAAKTEGQH